MLETCLLGTGGMMPLPYRWLTSLMVRYNGMSILFDAGEGTQIAMKKKDAFSRGSHQRPAGASSLDGQCRA